MADPLQDGVEADRLIARAIESVLDAVPEIPGTDLIAAEASPKAQPWAETAAPPGDKRPLESVLAEYEARVAAAPNARASHPSEPSPGVAYLEKLSPAPKSPAGKRPKRRWQGGRKRRGGRGGRGGGGGGAAPA